MKHWKNESKDEIEKDFKKSIGNGKKHYNKETQERARMVVKPEDTAAVTCQFE